MTVYTVLNVERLLVRKLASNACHEYDSINAVATAIEEVEAG